MKRKKICIIGTGYVGLVTGIGFAEVGHKVICVDNDKEKIKNLQNDIIPIYEPGLKKLILKNKKARRLFFTNEIKEGIKNSEIIFIAVPTPSKKSGEADLYYVESVTREIAKNIDKYKVIVTKSTIPVTTSKKIKEIIKIYSGKEVSFDVASNPEFLREGSAVNDFLHPERIVIGIENKKTERIMRELYEPIKAPIIVTNIETAEMIKHASNSFLAAKISFINAVANICEESGADIEKVAEAMGMDKRIGKLFLKAGIGYGGSCFPKDVEAFIYTAAQYNYDFKLLKEVQKINQMQKEKFVNRIRQNLWVLRDKKIGVWGLSFKPNTDDMRNAPSIDIINALIKEGAKIQAYDPVAIKKTKEIFKDKISFCSNPYQAAKNADVLIVVTEWDEFKNVDLKKTKRLLKLPKIIDGRNIFDPEKMKKLGFDYYSIGRKKL
jgi:UDPglucose 6-dehydrogenase